MRSTLLVDALGEDRLGLLVRHAGVALDGGEGLRDERLDLVRDRAPSCDFASQSSSLRSSGNLTASPQVHLAFAKVVGSLVDRSDVVAKRLKTLGGM